MLLLWDGTLQIWERQCQRSTASLISLSWSLAELLSWSQLQLIESFRNWGIEDGETTSTPNPMLRWEVENQSKTLSGAKIKIWPRNALLMLTRCRMEKIHLDAQASQLGLLWQQPRGLVFLGCIDRGRNTDNIHCRSILDRHNVDIGYLEYVHCDFLADRESRDRALLWSTELSRTQGQPSSHSFVHALVQFEGNRRFCDWNSTIKIKTQTRPD